MGKINRAKFNQFALDVLGLMENDSRRVPIEFHAEKKGSIPHVFDLKFFLHLRSKKEEIRANDDQVVNVRENPERGRILSPEDTRIGIGDQETNGDQKGAKTSVPGQGRLLESVDCFVETED